MRKIKTTWREWQDDASKRPLRFGRYLIFPGPRAKKLSVPQYLAFVLRLIRLQRPDTEPGLRKRVSNIWEKWRQDAAKRPIRFGRYMIFPGSSIKKLSIAQYLAFFTHAIDLPLKPLAQSDLPFTFQQNKPEFDSLLDIYRALEPKSVLEIGTWDGGSLYHWLQTAPAGAKVGSIDMMGRLSLEQLQKWSAPGVEPLQHTGNSHDREAVAFAREELAPIDFLFLDGDHSYEGCQQDLQDYLPLMSPNGVVALHDVKMEYLGKSKKMRRFWDVLLAQTGKREIWAELKADKRYATREIIYYPDPRTAPEATVLGIGVVFLSGKPID